MEYNLNRHYNMVHKRSIEENPVIPGLPQITTVMRENRNTRKISDLVTGLIETFECSNCHETFSKYDDYRSHMASQHTDSKKYICPHRNGSRIPWTYLQSEYCLISFKNRFLKNMLESLRTS